MLSRRFLGLTLMAQLQFSFELVLLEALRVGVLVEARVHWDGRQRGYGCGAICRRGEEAAEGANQLALHVS